MKSNRLFSIIALCASVFIFIFQVGASRSILADDGKQPIAPHVLVIAMFGSEAESWIAQEGLTEQVPVPGLSQSTGTAFLFPAVGTFSFNTVKCKPVTKNDKGDKADKNDDKSKNQRDICLLITDIGYANAASSVTALIQSGKFDLKTTYFLIAGIGGIDPLDGTLGGAAWARYSVDFGLAHEIDSSEKPAAWPYGYTAFGANNVIPEPPNGKPTRIIGTEVYHLNEALAQKAFDLTKGLDLTVNDAAGAKTYRALYKDPDANTNFGPARANPIVMMCDSVAVDTYWHGAVLSKRANDWAKLLTNGAANYCMTDEEDNATLTALKRGADAGLLSFDRIALLRTASNFDQPHVGQTPYQSLSTRSGGFLPSLKNAYLVGSTLVHAINGDWASWSQGIPAEGALSVKPK